MILSFIFLMIPVCIGWFIFKLVYGISDQEHAQKLIDAHQISAVGREAVRRPRYSKTFIILMLTVVPIFLIIVNLQFFEALYAANFGIESTGQVLKKSFDVSRGEIQQGLRTRDYALGTWSIQVKVPGSSLIREMEVEKNSWKEIVEGQNIHIKEAGLARVAVGYTYPKTFQLLICLSFILIVSIVFPLLPKR